MDMVMFSLAVMTLLCGHYFKMLRWKQFIDIYEIVGRGLLLRSLSIGYVVNLFFPFRIGDIVRALISGRRMKNGASFSLATIFVERYLDVLVVGLLFGCFYLKGMTTGQITSSTMFYILLSGVLIPMSVLFTKYSKYPKYIMRKFSSIFNSKIELVLLMFSWAIITAFKDMYLKIDKSVLFLNTVAMWCFYLISYYLFAIYISYQGVVYNFIDVFTLLFSYSNLDTATIGSAYRESNFIMQFPFLLGLYIISPLIIMLISSLFIDEFKKIYSFEENKNPYLSLIPYIADKDKLVFLEAYFSENNKDYISNYLAINRNINIIQDYSAGSNATTMLCLDAQRTFFRKYAFGKDGDKLHEQIEWLHMHENYLKLPKILHEEHGEGFCYYDMEYKNTAVSFFNYIHSVPTEVSWRILEQVLNDLRNHLHSKHNRKLDDVLLMRYISEKILKNLEIIKDAKQFKELFGYATLIINGKEYKNLREFEQYLTADYLNSIFVEDDCSDIHGDLTIENIICLQNQDQAEYYIIDPNTGNVHNSPFLDYGKLLQSLHGGYEFLMKTCNVTINDNRIDFLYTKSLAYDELLKKYKVYLNKHFTREQVRSIFFHEIVHYLRLMPYKIKKNGNRAVIFLASLVILLNDIIDNEELV